MFPVDDESIKVESDVAIPPPRRVGWVRRGVPSKYPWRQLAVGDSFFVETTGNPGYRLSGSRSWAEKTLGIKITQRQEGTGVRFFRVA